MNRILLIGPMPPPVGGDTISFSRLAQNKLLQENAEIIGIIDTSRKDEISIGRKLDLRDLKNGFKILRQLHKSIRKTDKVLLWANRRFLYTIGLIIILTAKCHGKNIIVKMFGGTFDRDFERLPRIYKKPATWILKKADYILPETRALCRYFLEKLKFNQTQVVHLPNCIPEEVTNVVNCGTAGELNQVKCIFIGQIKREKGVFDILKTLVMDSDIVCDFYGPILKRDKMEFLRAVEILENAHYKGVLAPGEVCQAISRYHILLLPTFYSGEGYPAVILEAFNSARPVLTTNWLALGELVEDGRDGFLVPVHSPEVIIDKLCSLRYDTGKYEYMCNNAREKGRHFLEGRVFGDILIPLLDASAITTK